MTRQKGRRGEKLLGGSEKCHASYKNISDFIQKKNLLGNVQELGKLSFVINEQPHTESA